MPNTLFTITDYSHTKNQCLEISIEFKESSKELRVKKSDFLQWLDREGRLDIGYGTLSNAEYFKLDKETIHLDLHDFIVGAKYKLVAKELADQIEEGLSDYQN